LPAALIPQPCPNCRRRGAQLPPPPLPLLPDHQEEASSDAQWTTAGRNPHTNIVTLCPAQFLHCPPPPPLILNFNPQNPSSL
jgi:hypothetical protein